MTFSEEMIVITTEFNKENVSEVNIAHMNWNKADW